MNHLLQIGEYTIYMDDVYSSGPVIPTLRAKLGSAHFLARCVEKSVLTSKIQQFLKNEVEFLAKFECPYLIKVRHIHENDNYYVCIYEDCSTGPLSKMEGKLDEGKILCFLTQILKIACVLSVDDIALTALTPDSIFVHVENGNLFYKLSTLIQNTSIDYRKNTEESPYFAPEIKNMSACVYSLGVLVTKLLSGTAKYVPESTSENLRHLISRCLEENPVKRIPLEDIMFHPFMAEPKRLIKEYEIGKLLGEGDFAEVYLATRLATKETVAIKQLKVQQAKLSLKFFDENTMLRYLFYLSREIALMYSIAYSTANKTGLSILKDHFLGENVLYLVIEYCKGSALSSVLKLYPKGLPKALLYSYSKDLASCLSHLHAMKIAHRCLTPQHVLLTETEPEIARLKIASFGLSTKLHEEVGYMEQIITSASYIPPEATNVGGGFEFSLSYDIWSYGVILYEMAFGVQPIHILKGEKEQQSLKINLMNKGKAKFIGREDLDGEFFELIKNCLKVNKNERPSAASILVCPLFNKIFI